MNTKSEISSLVYFSPAECSKSCEDEWCPYFHTSMWKIKGFPNLNFSTEQEANDQIKRSNYNGNDN